MSLLILSGCLGKNYKISKFKPDPKLRVITMDGTYNPESKPFSFIYDPEKWTIEKWEDAPNKLALVHNNFPNKKCAILPGTIGQGLDDSRNQIISGVLLTQHHKGETLDIYNPIGIHILRVVGYEIDGIPYIFEVKLPARDSDACEGESQPVIATFQFPEELKEFEKKLMELPEDKTAPAEETTPTEEPTIE